MTHSKYSLNFDFLIPLASYRKRFEKEYGSDVEIEKAKKAKNRPADFKRIFAGNTDESFRIGVSFLTKLRVD